MRLGEVYLCVCGGGTVGCVSQFGFSYGDKYHDQKQLVEERIYLAYTTGSQLVMMGSQSRNLKGRLKQRSWRSATYWLAQCAF